MLRILYVDHDLICRSMTTLTIWQLGYWNDVVSSLERALVAVTRQRYDLIFLDLAMPDRDVCAAAREIRQIERQHGYLPGLICATSAIDDPVLRQRCLDAGMEEFIGKPCSLDALRSTIRLAESAAAVRYDQFQLYRTAA